MSSSGFESTNLSV